MFKKGYIPWNKGLKTGIKSKTIFKKGNQINKGRISWNKDKKLSEGHIEHLSKAHIGQLAWNKGKTKKDFPQLANKRINYGSNSWNWKGGITKHKDYARLKAIKWRNTFRGRLLTRLQTKRRKKLAKGLNIKNVQRVYEENIKEFGTLTCYLCLKATQFGKDCLEHIIPLSRGGTNKYENLAVACQNCNSIKNNKLLEELVT